MPTAKQITDELDFLSTELSERTRWLCGGVLVASWTLIKHAEGSGRPILALAALAAAVLSLFADFLQYGSGYFHYLGVLNAAGKAEPRPPPERRFFQRLTGTSASLDENAATIDDRDTPLRRARSLFFYVKIAMGLISALCFGAAMVQAVLCLHGGAGDESGASVHF